LFFNILFISRKVTLPYFALGVEQNVIRLKCVCKNRKETKKGKNKNRRNNQGRTKNHKDVEIQILLGTECTHVRHFAILSTPAQELWAHFKQKEHWSILQ
jgi:hypothetical protein